MKQQPIDILERAISLGASDKLISDLTLIRESYKYGKRKVIPYCIISGILAIFSI